MHQDKPHKKPYKYTYQKTILNDEQCLRVKTDSAAFNAIN